MAGARLILVLVALVACSGDKPRVEPTPRPVAIAPDPVESESADVDEVIAPQAIHDGAKVPVRADDPSWGAPDAPVTLVEYANFECVHCQRMQPTLGALRARYGPKKLRIVWKDHPLSGHKRALPVHVAARAVFAHGGSSAFWKFHDLAFANRNKLSPANIEAWAEVAGVAPATFRALLTDPRHAERVGAGVSEAKDLGLRATPAVFLNGILISGVKPFDFFAKEIDKQLLEAASLMASGTPSDRVYIALTEKNFKPPRRAGAGDTTTIWKIAVHKDDPVKGKPDALVTVVWFGDFGAAATSRVNVTLTQLMNDYGDQLRLVWKDAPDETHPRGMAAALAGRELFTQKSHDGFWALHALMVANPAKLEEADLLGYAAQVGATAPPLKKALAQTAGAHVDFIDQSHLMALDYQADVLPTFFVNGRRVRALSAVEDIKPIVDSEIARAKELLASGVVAAALYGELIKNGKEARPLEKRSVPSPPSDAPFRGNRRAKVTMQVFVDFQGLSGNRTSSIVDRVIADFGTKVKVAFRHRPMPYHRGAPLAHQVAQEAYAQKSNAGFWKMHDKLFANPKARTRDALLKIGAEIGMDVTKIGAALDGSTHQSRIDTDRAAADAAGIKSAPGFLVNGYVIMGLPAYVRFKQVIRLALKEAP